MPKRTQAKQATFSKQDILQSNQFTNVQKDFLHAFLDDGKTYTIADAKKILEQKLKGVVK